MAQFSDNIDNLEHWQTNRRQVIKAAILTGTLSQLSFLQACTANQLTEEGNDLLDANQVGILKSVMEILFPNDGNGPGIDDLHAFEYIMWVLHDTGSYEKYRNLAIEGITWADEQTQKNQQKNYLELSQAEREQAVAHFNETDYGTEWLSIILTYILEALLLDPIYGGNPDGIGWKWLNHTPGYPQATEELRYENILKTVRAAYPKTES
ncbi:MAG: gluconate 2-dehydrogenase subunit 3 family protein [Bacteroidetes bacterium]|nr:gluconate 2-dehydrogenase subunit 3 family protein [Bacteroidota bacterium]